MTTEQFFHAKASMRNKRTGGLSVPAFTVLFGVSSSLALASDAMSQTVEFDIPEQSITSALREFSKQADVQLMVGSVPIVGERSAGVKGRLSAASALTELLRNTHLTYETVGNGDMIAVKRVSLSHLNTAETVSTELSLSQPSKGKIDDVGGNADDSKQRPDLEEVIVTAQKREQKLQEVPISISVMSGAELDKSTDTSMAEALNRVPGVATLASAQGGGTQLAVRGVTASQPLLGGSSPIAYYLDEVPFGTVLSAVVPDANPYDLQRVEVLRGPQGTLYGASAQNGVVRIITHDADMEDFELKGRASLSATENGGENYRADMAANLPIAPGRLAARAVVGYQDLSGWIDRPNLNRKEANDGEIKNARLKLNARPIDDLSIGLSAALSRSNFGAPSQSANGFENVRLNEPASADYDIYGLKVGYQFPWMSVSGTTGYLDYTTDTFLDLRPAFSEELRTIIDAEVLSQEILFSSTHDGAWRWSIGAMYRDAEDAFQQALGLQPVLLGQSNASESTAVFGELTRVFLDGHLELTGGLRHFEDKVSQREHVRQASSPSGPVGVVPAAPIRNDSKFEKRSPRAVVTWLPSNQLTVYASYSEGFRSGSAQSPSVLLITNFPPLEPDNLTNYEIGTKGAWLDGKLNFDIAIYQIDWKDVQQTISVSVPGFSNFISARVNGTSASGTGVDFGVSAQPVDGLKLGASVSWNDLQMDNDVISSGVTLFDKGDRLNGSSEYTIGASADYVRVLGSRGLEARFSASGNYVSKQEVRTIFLGAKTIAAGDQMLIGRTSFSISEPDKWTVTLFVDNVSNEDGIARWNSAITTGLFSEWAQRVRPRTVGAQFDYQF